MSVFSTTGDPGWQPLGRTPDPTPVRVWGTAETLPPVGVRRLWRGAEFLPLRP